MKYRRIGIVLALAVLVNGIAFSQVVTDLRINLHFREEPVLEVDDSIRTVIESAISAPSLLSHVIVEYHEVDEVDEPMATAEGSGPVRELIQLIKERRLIFLIERAGPALDSFCEWELRPEKLTINIPPVLSATYDVDDLCAVWQSKDEENGEPEEEEKSGSDSN